MHQPRVLDPPRPRHPRPPEVPRRPHDAGMTTSEYAVGTVGACGVGGVLWALVDDDYFRAFVARVVSGAPDVLDRVFGSTPGIPGVMM